MSLILNPITKKLMDNIVDNPPHAIMIVAPEGSGKNSLVQYLSQRILKLKNKQEFSNYPYFFRFRPENNVITIDSVRDMISKARLKTSGVNSIRRIIFIEDGHKMGIEAQNALLKLLEEPPADTCIILSTTDRNQVLPTVLSRSTVLKVSLPTKQQLADYYVKKGYSHAQIDKCYLLSRGRPGLFNALLLDDAQHPLVKSIEQIKTLLSMSTYQRLIYINHPDFKNTDVENLLDGFMSICSVAIAQASKKDNRNEVTRWLGIYKIVTKTYDIKNTHPNTNLLFSNLVLSM